MSKTLNASTEPNHVGLLRNAADEIERLRRHNHNMAGKLEMFNKCMRLIDINARDRNGIVSESARDIVHEMRKEINLIPKV